MSADLHKDICAYLKACVEANGPGAPEIEVALDCLSSAWAMEDVKPSTAILDRYKESTSTSTPQVSTKPEIEMSAAELEALHWNKFHQQLVDSGVLKPGSDTYDDGLELAKQKFEDRKKRLQESADNFKSLGNTAFQNNQLDEAIDYYNQAIELAGTNAIYWSNRAAVYITKQDYDQALADATRAITLDPTYAKAYNRLGRIYIAKNDNEKAVKAFEDALRVDPSNTAAKTGLDEARLKTTAGAGTPQFDPNQMADVMGNFLQGQNGIDPTQISSMLNNPEVMNQMNNVLGNMDPAILQNMASAFMGNMGGGAGGQ